MREVVPQARRDSGDFGVSLCQTGKGTMNVVDVKRLIRRGETDEVEFGHEPDQTVRTVKLDASG